MFNRASTIVTLLTLAVVAQAGEPVLVAPGMFKSAQQPQAAVDAAGHIHLVFGASGAVYYTQSSDAGKTFSKPAKVAQPNALALGMRRGPRIAVSGKTIVVAAVGGASKADTLLAWRSKDAGVTWQAPVTINDVEASAREGLHALAAGPKGELFTAWLDLRSGQMELYGSSSQDAGASWSANQLIYKSPDGPICQCCHPTAVYGPTGELHVMWRNSLAGNRDMYVTMSRSGGKFSQPVKLGSGTWPIDHCPMDGGMLAVSSAGQVSTIWRRENQVYSTSNGPAEILLGPGEQPWAAAGKRGTYFAWINRRPGTLWLQSPDEKAPRKLAVEACDPVVAAPLSTTGPVVAVWESGPRNRATIMAQVVSD